MSIVRLKHLLSCRQKAHQIFDKSESMIIGVQSSNRFYSTETFLKTSSTNDDWRQIFKEAEKLVDYPTPYENLRWLLSDKVASVGQQLRKLSTSGNILHRTAK